MSATHSASSAIAAIALVTERAHPELHADDQPLATALAARGHDVRVVAWDDPAFDWSGARLVVLRNPWDYHQRLADFLGWAEGVARVTTLLNPIDAVRWNVHKGYLVELADSGAPIVPTLLLRRGQAVELGALLAAHGWSDFVLKPAVSADSWETYRLRADEVALAQAHVERLLPGRDLLLQPFLDAVEGHGERCYVFLGGDFSHAVRKNPLTRGGRFAGVPEAEPVEPRADELEAARRVLAACPHRDLLYARVDLVPDGDGRPRLLELELVEPTLFLAEAPGALPRLVAAIERRLEPLVNG